MWLHFMCPLNELSYNKQLYKDKTWGTYIWYYYQKYVLPLKTHFITRKKSLSVWLTRCFSQTTPCPSVQTTLVLRHHAALHKETPRGSGCLPGWTQQSSPVSLWVSTSLPGGFTQACKTVLHTVVVMNVFVKCLNSMKCLSITQVVLVCVCVCVCVTEWMLSVIRRQIGDPV